MAHEFYNGLNSRHLQKANELITRLDNFILDNAGKMSINDLFIAECLYSCKKTMDNEIYFERPYCKPWHNSKCHELVIKDGVMDYNDLIKEAIIVFPEFSEEYNSIINSSKPDLSILTFYMNDFQQKIQEQINHNKTIMPVYQFYEDIVRQQFIKLIDEYYLYRDDDVLKKISKMTDFFERLAMSENIDVQNVLVVGILEGITEDKEKEKLIKSLLKERSRILCEL